MIEPRSARLEHLGFTGDIACTGAGTARGGESLDDGADARLDAWLRQAAPLHPDARAVVDFYLLQAAALLVLCRLIQQVWMRYRCPTTRRLK